MADAAEISWPNFVPWFLVAFGWVIVNWQNNSREKRKEVRSKVDAIKSSIDEIEESAIAHHTQAQEELRCMHIKRALVRTSREISIIGIAGLQISDCVKAHARLRQAATLQNFDTSNYQKVSFADPIVLDIGVTSDSLRTNLENAYARKFHKSLLDRIRDKI